MSPQKTLLNILLMEFKIDTFRPKHNAAVSMLLQMLQIVYVVCASLLKTDHF